jgi:hypothetical protein
MGGSIAVDAKTGSPFSPARLRALAAELAAGMPIAPDEIKAWRDTGRP